MMIIFPFSLTAMLQKGDGSWLDFSSYPSIATLTMGNGQKRPVKCANCDGNAQKTSLLNVVSLASGPSGDIYVGDFNHIRNIDSEGNVKTVLNLKPSQGSYQYDLKVSPADGMLYIAHAEERQIWRVYEGEHQIVAGTGQRCVPGDRDACGNGGPALRARLDYPKGLAIAVDNTIYFTDGRNVRVIFSDGTIDTLIGHHKHVMGPPRPLGCETTFQSSDIQLQWPTKLALNPLDHTLHIVDDTMVIKLTADMRVQVVAGVSPACDDVPDKVLGQIIDVSFASDGDLFVLEKQSSEPLRGLVRVIDDLGSISDFAGQNILHSDSFAVQNSAKISNPCLCTSLSNCTNTNHKCSTKSNILASQLIINAATAITVTPDKSVHVSDNTLRQILGFKKAKPASDPNSGEVTVADPMSKELYTFNRYGQHLSTVNLDTGVTLYTFSYSKNTVFGRLTVVTDALGNKISLQRDYTNRVQSIENTLGQKHTVKLSRMGHLQTFKTSDGSLIQINYEESSGLLTSKAEKKGEFYVFDYDRFGRVKQAVLPTGESFQFSTWVGHDCPEESGDPGFCVKILRNGGDEEVQRMQVHKSGKVVFKRGKRIIQESVFLFFNIPRFFFATIRNCKSRSEIVQRHEFAISKISQGIFLFSLSLSLFLQVWRKKPS